MKAWELIIEQIAETMEKAKCPLSGDQRAILAGCLAINSSLEKPVKFDPNTDEHLIYTLKAAYLFSLGKGDLGSAEMANHLCDALCNLIGDKKFIDFLEQEQDQ